MRENTILVLDGEQRASLAITRSLGRKKLSIIVGSEKSEPLSGASRYCSQYFQYTSPYKSQHKFLEDIIRVINDNRVILLIPVTDISMYTVLKNIKEFPSYLGIPFASFEKYQLASNKIWLIKKAMELNIPVPASIFIDDKSTEIPCELNYPVVLKPVSSMIQTEDELLRTSVMIVNNRTEHEYILKKSNITRYPYMMQEKVQGEGIGVFTLFWEGKPLAIFNHRRIREKPPWGGVSVVSESREPEMKAQEYAIKILTELRWHGPAMVEFKWDVNQSIPILMEINARFWGSLQLAIDSGVDFPFILYQLWTGEPISPVTSYKHSRLRWLLGDIDNLFIALKTDKTKLPKEYHNKSKVIYEFIMEFIIKSKDEILRIDDMKPFYLELKQYICDHIRRSRFE